MKNAITLGKHPVRQSTFYSKYDKNVPAALFEIKNDSPDLTDFPYPLPCKKSDYTVFAEGDGVIWYGAKRGLTRFEESAEFEYDRVMYFSADRDLPDNDVKAILPQGRNAWVLTSSGVTYIEERLLSPTQICAELLNETIRYIDRHGMISQKRLRQPGVLESAYNYGHSDNDGGFTACFDIGEIFRYATLKREKGENAPETLEAKAIAIRALEACLLLMHIHGRGDGFVARTYLTKDEPVPDDGIFFKRQGDYAVCLDTSFAREKNCVGYKVPCNAEIPERLRHLFTDEGYTEDDITYKADTSSDEITLQLLNLLCAHLLLTKDSDPELDEIIKDSVRGIMSHIIDNDFVLVDYSGQSTTWAKWTEEYFKDEMGYVDGALNSAELLFYLKTTMAITGEEGRWKETYDYLVNDRGYADMAQQHYDRLMQASILSGMDLPEDIMFGDHMLACASFAGLCLLEEEEPTLTKYRNGFKAWRTTLDKEHNPAYDFMYLLACPTESVDTDRIKEWYYRSNISRIASGVSLIGRHDIPVKTLKDGYKQTSVLLPPDERFISKYDRDPLAYKNVDSGGSLCVENCYVYTYAYWIGRYFGFIEGE